MQPIEEILHQYNKRVVQNARVVGSIVWCSDEWFSYPSMIADFLALLIEYLLLPREVTEQESIRFPLVHVSAQLLPDALPHHASLTSSERMGLASK